MAVYDKEGTCPSNLLTKCAVNYGEKISDNYDRVCELLGARVNFMVYPYGEENYNGWPYVCDCLAGATGTIGIEIARHLQFLIPDCQYGKSRCKILCTDVINPFAIPFADLKDDGKWCGTQNKMVIFEDERFICGIMEEGQEVVHMYFFKK